MKKLTLYLLFLIALTAIGIVVSRSRAEETISTQSVTDRWYPATYVFEANPDGTFASLKVIAVRRSFDESSNLVSEVGRTLMLSGADLNQAFTDISLPQATAESKLYNLATNAWFTGLFK